MLPKGLNDQINSVVIGKQATQLVVAMRQMIPESQEINQKKSHPKFEVNKERNQHKEKKSQTKAKSGARFILI